jgi:hypothetical protein
MAWSRLPSVIAALALTPALALAAGVPKARNVILMISDHDTFRSQNARRMKKPPLNHKSPSNETIPHCKHRTWPRGFVSRGFALPGQRCRAGPG